MTDFMDLVSQLRETLGKLEMALAVIREAIVWTDESGNIQWCNRSFDQLVELKHIEVLGKSLVESLPLIQGNHSLTPKAYPVNIVLAGQSHIIGSYGFHRANQKLILEISATSTKLESNKTSVVLVIRDITERKQMEGTLLKRTEELTRSNAELELFAYIASHDLREPLRKIANFTELLAKRYKGQLDTDADSFINYVLDGVTRMQRLIDDLLNYSRVGRGEPILESVDLNGIVDQILNDLNLTIQKKGAIVTRDPLPTVTAHSTQVTELLQNLIENALKFHGPEAPRVHISAVQKNGEWVISVRDHGIGIDAPYFDRIFKIFQRLHRREEYPGTGIGLAICKKIVEQHHGRIWVESQLGLGSTFYVSLPNLLSNNEAS